MPYKPDRDPYIPGDPYSYDLKWIVDKLKEIDRRLDAIQAQLDEPDAEPEDVQ